MAKKPAKSATTAKAPAKPASPKFVKMTRSAEDYPAPHTADVHPDEVANFKVGGWQES